MIEKMASKEYGRWLEFCRNKANIEVGCFTFLSIRFKKAYVTACGSFFFNIAINSFL